MPATRRETLHYLLAGVGAPMLAGGCVSTSDISGLGATRQFYRTNEFTWLSRLSDLIIPATDTPGALAAGVPQFLDGLMQGWASPQTQGTHRLLLSEVAEALDTNFDNFLQRPVDSAITTLEAFDQNAYVSSDVPAYDGYRQLKQMITRAYFVSEPGAIEELNWQLVPGRWDPAVEFGT